MHPRGAAQEEQKIRTEVELFFAYESTTWSSCPDRKDRRAFGHCLYWTTARGYAGEVECPASTRSAEERVNRRNDAPEVGEPMLLQSAPVEDGQSVSHAKASSSAFATLKSFVSKPSVNLT